MKPPSTEEIKNIIAELTNIPISRKELIAKCIKKLNLSDEILKDKSPGAELNKIKCLFGNTVTDLITSGILIQADDSTLQYYIDENTDKKPTVESVKRDIEIEQIIRSLLSQKPHSKKELLSAVVNKLKADLPTDTVKADAGRLLSEAIKNGSIIRNGNIYSLYVEKIATKETLEAKNERLFSKLSDESLVDQSISMMEKWYKYKGYVQLKSQNTDGPQDGGIDGIIKAVDELNYSETIIIQVKNIHNTEKHVKLCDVREFCGVLSAKQDATKGLFITSGKYHSDTTKFAKSFKTKYFVLIDMKLWLKLAKECEYEITE